MTDEAVETAADATTATAKRTRAKAETKIQTKIAPDVIEAMGLPEGTNGWIDLETDEPIGTTAKAVSLLNKQEKAAGDQFQIIGVKKEFKARVKEVTACEEV